MQCLPGIVRVPESPRQSLRLRGWHFPLRLFIGFFIVICVFIEQFVTFYDFQSERYIFGKLLRRRNATLGAVFGSGSGSGLVGFYFSSCRYFWLQLARSRSELVFLLGARRRAGENCSIKVNKQQVPVTKRIEEPLAFYSEE